jgi:hypothetical protein
MSIGGNDVGFGALAVYALTEHLGDLAPIAGLAGGSTRFGPQVSRAYLEMLDERMQAVKDALRDGFGVAPSRVVQSSYEPIQYDEVGTLCGAQPTLGMDVHPGLRIDRHRLQETADFLHDFLARLECISGKARSSCPGNLATGSGTGFMLVTDHIPEFSKRGLCARAPKRGLADDIAMGMPRKSRNGDAFRPYSPAATLPYAANGVSSVRPMMLSWRPIRTERARPCSTFCSRPMRRFTAAPSTRPRKRTPSSPTTSYGMCARFWTSATQSRSPPEVAPAKRRPSRARH